MGGLVAFLSVIITGYQAFAFSPVLDRPVLISCEEILKYG
jgi:hypothetical protein